MKRCPECRRDYYDETLLYCLDDGNALLDGPASVPMGDEPATAILHSTDAPSDADTRPQIQTTDRTAILPSNVDAAKTLVKRRRLTRAVIVAVVAVFVAGGAFAYYKFASRGLVVSFERATLDKVTESGEIQKATISPDGKWLVYVYYISGLQESLWLQQVGVAGSSKEIVPPADVTYAGATFSQNADYIYYTVKDKRGPGSVDGTLYQVPILGGAAKKLLTNISSGAAFSPDGKRVAYFYLATGENQTTGTENRLMIANADGSDQRVLAARTGNEFLNAGPSLWHSRPAWSPDSKLIVAVSGTVDPPVKNLVTISPDTGEITPFSTGKFRGLGEPTWLADGKSLLVLASERSTAREDAKIWQISYPSGEVRKIAGESNTPGIFYRGLSLTVDSTVLATTQWTERTTFWTASTSDPTAAVELKLGTDIVTRPAWTPDGKIVFSKSSGDATELYITDAQGGNPKPLTSTGGVNAEPDISPDGRYIVFSSDRTGNPQLWRSDIDGNNPKQLTPEGINSDPSISPDGRDVYYTCVVKRSNRICKVGIDGGDSKRLTETASAYPQISADGKWILCLYRADANAPLNIAIVPAEGGTPTKTFPRPTASNDFPRWMPGDRSFFYSTAKGYISDLWIQPIDGGPPKQYTNFTSLYIPWADFSLDGRIVYQRASSYADIILIKGFKK